MKKQNPLIVWLLVLIVTIACITAVYFFFDTIKWLIIILVILTASGAAGLKDGIKTAAWIFVICSGIFCVLWFMESPEYRAGIKAYENGDYNQAIKELTVDIEKRTGSENSKGYLARCRALRKTGQPKQALPDCNRAINLGYEYENESYAARARVYSDLGMALQEVQDLTRALKNTSWSSENSRWFLLYERGYANNDLKQYDKAIRDFQTVLNLNKEWYHAWLPMGNAFYQKGEHKKGLQAYEKYLNSYDPKEDSFPEALKKRINTLRGQSQKP